MMGSLSWLVPENMLCFVCILVGEICFISHGKESYNNVIIIWFLKKLIMKIKIKKIT